MEIVRVRRFYNTPVAFNRKKNFFYLQFLQRPVIRKTVVELASGSNLGAAVGFEVGASVLFESVALPVLFKPIVSFEYISGLGTNSNPCSLRLPDHTQEGRPSTVSITISTSAERVRK